MEKKQKKRISQPPLVKHVLTSPFEIQWPKLDEKVNDKIIELLKSSFTDVKLQSVKKPRSERNKQRKDDKSVRKRKSKYEITNRNEKIPKLELYEEGSTECKRDRNTEEVITECKRDREVGAKCKRVGAECKKNKNTEEIDEVVLSDTINIKTLACERTLVTPQSHSLSIGDCITANDVIKKNQFVVGINNVTRCLERDKLRAALVCLSARPPLVTQHLLMLSATRDCPVLALLNLSNTLSPLLGINSVLAIGFKKITSHDETDHFKKLIAFIINNACSLSLPWLSNKDNSQPSYLPLKIKALTPKSSL